VNIDATAQQIRALLRLDELDELDEDVPGDLPRILVERYRFLVNAGRTPAVVAIEQGACSGCHLRLPTMFESMARRSLAVHTCPHCRRMLYAPELVRPASPADEAKPSRRAAPASAARRS
jgi:predicted  nucleic acid-binding Zn-ribbon protein